MVKGDCRAGSKSVRKKCFRYFDLVAGHNAPGCDEIAVASPGQHFKQDEPGVLEHGLQESQGSRGVGVGVDKSGVSSGVGVSVGIAISVADDSEVKPTPPKVSVLLRPKTPAVIARAKSTSTIRVAEVKRVRLFMVLSSFDEITGTTVAPTVNAGNDSEKNRDLKTYPSVPDPCARILRLVSQISLRLNISNAACDARQRISSRSPGIISFLCSVCASSASAM